MTLEHKRVMRVSRRVGAVYSCLASAVFGALLELKGATQPRLFQQIENNWSRLHPSSMLSVVRVYVRVCVCGCVSIYLSLCSICLRLFACVSVYVYLSACVCLRVCRVYVCLSV
jgi:hypothetical protein